MKIYRGEIKMIGAGTWSDGGGGGKTTVSALEIGNDTLKKIVVTDYLGNYLAVGSEAQLLVSKGLSQGLVTRPYVAAVVVDGKKYKTGSGQLILGNAIRGALYAGPAYLIGAGLGGSILGLAFAAAAAGYYVKEYLDFVKF